ncbi:MAG TPA: hypothetical protein VEC19_01070 [Usitatibacter sp.]|nr:hypothetical protein [Usitatibacter sp.]
MKVWDPKIIWDELKRALLGMPEDDEQGEPAADPTLVFHMLFTAPLLLGLLLMARRG